MAEPTRPAWPATKIRASFGIGVHSHPQSSHARRHSFDTGRSTHRGGHAPVEVVRVPIAAVHCRQVQTWSTFAVSETINTVNTLEYPYTRTTGPYMGPFLTALRDGKLIANKVGGRTFCPPLEYDPDTGATAPAEFVEVGPGGTVVGWTWVAEPSEKHPFQHPFAFALIKIDGTDVPMIHAVDAGTIHDDGDADAGRRAVPRRAPRGDHRRVLRARWPRRRRRPSRRATSRSRSPST